MEWQRLSGRSFRRARRRSRPRPRAPSPTPCCFIRSGTRWVRYAGDWALYDGYVTESGRTTVELRVRTAPERIAPHRPNSSTGFISTAQRGGNVAHAPQGVFTRPRFSSAPGYGSAITFADVARHPIRQSALLEALQHLFNLRFHTEEETKTVRIEPADEFFRQRNHGRLARQERFRSLWCWPTSPPEIHESRTWGYQESDGAVNRFNAGAGAPFGGVERPHRFPMPHERATQVLRNPSSGPRSARLGTMPTPLGADHAGRRPG